MDIICYNNRPPPHNIRYLKSSVFVFCRWSELCLGYKRRLGSGFTDPRLCHICRNMSVHERNMANAGEIVAIPLCILNNKLYNKY